MCVCVRTHVREHTCACVCDCVCETEREREIVTNWIGFHISVLHFCTLFLLDQLFGKCSLLFDFVVLSHPVR